MKNIPFTENEIKEIKDHYSHELEKLQKRAAEIKGIIQKMDGSKPVAAVQTEKVEAPVVKVKKEKAVKPVKAVKVAVVKTPNVESAKIKNSKATDKPVVTPTITTTAKIGKAEKKNTAKAAKQPKAVVAKKTGGVAKVKSVKAKTEKADTTGVVKKGRRVSLDSKKSVYEKYILDIIKKEGKLISSKVIFDSVEKQFKVKAPDYSKMKATVTVILSKTKANGALKDYPQPGVKTKLYGLIEWFDDKGKLKDQSKLK